MDNVDLKVRETVLGGVARAYGFRPVVDRPGCVECGGDGCESCEFTGLPEDERG